MRNVLSWNVSLGRWADVQVRLHVAFLVLITAVLHLCTGPAAAREYAPALWGLTILFLSVVAHEFGHCMAVWRSGGRIEQVVLGPWGGLTYLHPTRERQTELLIAAAGPAMNLALCAAALMTLAVLRQPVDAVLRPFTLPALAEATTFVQVTALVAWINALIVLVNLLPAFPLDGARALRAVLRPMYGFRTAVVFTARTGFAMVVGLLAAAWLLRHDFDKASLACTLLGMFLYFSDREEVNRLHDRDASDDEGYDERYDDEEEDEVPPPRRRQGPLRRWIDQRREERLAKRLEQEREEESLVDEVLMRLHTLGPAALSTSDRALLQRVSARYRERQQG